MSNLQPCIVRDPKKKSYSAAYTLGEPLSNFGIALVLRSETTEIPVGAHVYGWLSTSLFLSQSSSTISHFQRRLPTLRSPQ